MTPIYDISFSNTFNKDLKRIKKRGYDLALMSVVVAKLQAGEALDAKYKDHSLTGNWKGYRECHILPDWLLVYRIDNDMLMLVLSRTGTHSDLGTMQNLISHFLLKNTVCLRVSESEMYQLFLHSSLDF